MPTSVIAHSAFISSPGDVAKERKIAPRIIADLNRVYLQATGNILWPLMWEAMSGGLGEDVQAVVNRQTPDYDIFVGILWSRFGTPTRRAGSGTAEEFDRALALHRSGKRNVQFMVFVKSADLPNGVDPDQLRSVRAFVERLQDTGILLHRFHTTAEFETKLRDHMLAYLLDRTTRTTGPMGEPTAVAARSGERPYAALLSDIVRFSESLRQSIACMAAPKRAKFEQGRHLLHEATVRLVADGGANIKDLMDWTYAFGRSCYSTTRIPCSAAERMTAVAELNSVGEQIQEWQRLMVKAPSGDDSVNGEFAVAREFLDHCHCAIQTSACSLNGALRL
jgi:hypothetical protein